MSISPTIILWIIAFVPALVLHEFGHAFAAFKLGDPTAQKAGRLSFNPLAHIDPFGTVILPLLCALSNMPVFGYAKPVPYNPRYFKDPRKGDLIVGMAGPFANLVQAGIGALVAWGLTLGIPDAFPMPYGSPLYYIVLFLSIYVQVNLFLMFFNLLPIPPLDGSSIFAFFCPPKYLPQYYKIQQWAFPIFMLVLLALPSILGFSPFSWYLDVTADNLYDVMMPTFYYK